MRRTCDEGLSSALVAGQDRTVEVHFLTSSADVTDCHDEQQKSQDKFSNTLQESPFTHVPSVLPGEYTLMQKMTCVMDCGIFRKFTVIVSSCDKVFCCNMLVGTLQMKMGWSARDIKQLTGPLPSPETSSPECLMLPHELRSLRKFTMSASCQCRIIRIGVSVKVATAHRVQIRVSS